MCVDTFWTKKQIIRHADSREGGENMKLLSIWNMELMTIGTLAIFVVLMEIQSLSWKEKGSDTEVKIWRLKARSVQAAEGVMGALMKYKQLTSEVLLGKEHYYIGNRVYDDIYIKSGSKARVRAYLNMHEDRILMTVIRGEVFVDERVYGANCKKRITLSEFSSVRFADTDMVFQKLKKEMW